jgi:hypothetical protein
MFGFLASPCTVIVDSTVHVVACFVARVLRHPAVREVLESIVLASTANVQQEHQLPSTHVDSNDASEQIWQQLHEQQHLQQGSCEGDYGTMTTTIMKGEDHVSIDFTTTDANNKNSAVDASCTHESRSREVHQGDGVDGHKNVTASMNEDEPDDGSIPTTITPTASQTPILVVPKALDSVMSSPIIKSTIPPNVELTLGQYAQTNRSNNPDDKTLPQEPTFFYKEIISSHTRHMIIVVEAPILKDNHHDQDHDDHQPATVGTTSTTSTTTPRPDATNRNKDKGANMLDLSISNNTTGRIVYQTPLTKDVKMAENLNDYADPDEYLWSITRRAAHRAASEGGNVV